MIDDMIRDKGEASGATAAGRRPVEDQREMTSDFAEEANQTESLGAIVETLNSASKGKSTGKGKKGLWTEEA